jgi:hypothetical protein
MGSFSVEFYSKNSTVTVYQIVDTQGRVIVKKELSISEGLNSYSLDHDLGVGLYFLEIDNQQIKIIVQ